MQVLVTGGYGFIGAWTVRKLLEAGHRIRIFENHNDPGLPKTPLREGTAKTVEFYRTHAALARV